MKVPMIVAALSIGSTFLFGEAFRTRAPEPSKPVDGFVMGQDFSTLLANPNVTLKIERQGNTVYFAWTSASPARLDETQKMGEYMISAKRELEYRGQMPDQGNLSRTASAEK